MPAFIQPTHESVKHREVVVGRPPVYWGYAPQKASVNAWAFQRFRISRFSAVLKQIE